MPLNPQPVVRGISSMATRRLLAELASIHAHECGVAVEFESVGGVEVPRRLKAGEEFDLVVLASAALASLVDDASISPATPRPFAVSPAALAVRAGAPAPAVDSCETLIQALRGARSIGYSTGPSGDALVSLLDRAGILAEVRPRLVQAPPGVPVATLIADGKVQIGFQQLSELADRDGVTLLGPLPEDASLQTTFSAALGTRSRQKERAQAFIDFIASPAAFATIRRAYMRPMVQIDPIAGGSS